METGESETQRTKALRRLDGIRNLQVRVCHYLYAEDEDVSPTSKVILIKASVRKVSSLEEGFTCKRSVSRRYLLLTFEPAKLVAVITCYFSKFPIIQHC